MSNRRKNAFEIITYTVTIGTGPLAQGKATRVKEQRMWGAKSIIWHAKNDCQALDNGWWRVECEGKIVDEGGNLKAMLS